MSVQVGPESLERYRELLEESFDQVEKAVAWVSRRLCLTGDDADEFRSWVNEKLVDDGYRVLREFKGRSSLATYLVAVIQNLGRDYRMKKWGRWRTSAAAVRLGLEAEQLETLLARDGFTLDEASEHLRSNHGVRMTHLDIVELAARLPSRTPFRSEGEAAGKSAEGPFRTDAGILESERKATLEKVRRSLVDAMAKIGSVDRLVLRMYYRNGLSMSVIAKALCLDQRSLYTRRDRCCREFRASLKAAGLSGFEVLDALQTPSLGFELDYGFEAMELGQIRPSNTLKACSKEEV